MKIREIDHRRRQGGAAQIVGIGVGRVGIAVAGQGKPLETVGAGVAVVVEMPFAGMVGAIVRWLQELRQ